MRRAFMAIMAAGTLLAMAGAAGAAGPPRQQTVPVDWHMQAVTVEDDISAGAVEGASASVVATSSGASLRIHTRDLVPGNAYTLWLVFVNNPAACDPSPCTAADILTNLDVDAQVTYGAGRIAGESGRATFSARLNAGPVDGWLKGCSLDDPRSAEYHLVINDHGPKLAEHMPDMIRTYRGGCGDEESPFPGIFPDTALADGQPGPNRCLLFQAAIFQP